MAIRASLGPKRQPDRDTASHTLVRPAGRFRTWPHSRTLSFARMSTDREFDVVIVAEPEGGYSVFVPELPSVATQGETIEEARANAQEAIEGYLEVMHEDGLPVPTVHRDRVAVHAT